MQVEKFVEIGAKVQSVTTPDQIRPGVQVERTSRTPLFIAGTTALVCLLLLVVLPGSLSNKLLLLSSGACAQRPAHSYYLGDMQLPMEGRMVGIFGAYSLTLFFLWFIGRGRAFHQPPLAIRLALAAMVCSMAFDGLNATAFDMGLPTLYAPQNWLRLTTGVLSGIGLAGLVQPFFNSLIWQRGYNRRSFQSWLELGAMLVLGLLLWLATVSGWGWLYWPVALLTVGGIIAALVMINLLIFTFALRLDNRVESFRAFLTPLSLVFIFSVGEMVLFSWLRIALIGPPV